MYVLKVFKIVFLYFLGIQFLVYLIPNKFRKKYIYLENQFSIQKKLLWRFKTL